jgi:hypothetical protein
MSTAFVTFGRTTVFYFKFNSGQGLLQRRIWVTFMSEKSVHKIRILHRSEIRVCSAKTSPWLKRKRSEKRKQIEKVLACSFSFVQMSRKEQDLPKMHPIH